jgi:flagellar basal-body rod modification protein FlgD
MNVSAVNQASSAYSPTTSSTQESKDQFLQLLVTQLQNQNPLDPMSNEEFTAQLTQFSMLEQLEEMNQNMEQDMSYSQSLNNTMMLSIVGRTASVVSDGVEVSEGTAATSRLEVGSNGVATVEVKNSAGEVVASYTESVDAGWNDLTWDGLLSDGEQADDGSYTLSVTVEDAAENEIQSQLYATGLVQSIRFENNLAVLSVNGHDYYASEIAEVGQ